MTCCHVTSSDSFTLQKLVNEFCIWPNLALRRYFSLKIVPTGAIRQSRSCNGRWSDSISATQPSWLYCLRGQPFWWKPCLPEDGEGARHDAAFVHSAFVPRWAGREAFHRFPVVKHSAHFHSTISTAPNGDIYFWNTEVLRKAGSLRELHGRNSSTRSGLTRNRRTKWEIVWNQRCWGHKLDFWCSWLFGMKQQSPKEKNLERAPCSFNTGTISCRDLLSGDAFPHV